MNPSTAPQDLRGEATLNICELITKNSLPEVKLKLKASIGGIRGTKVCATTYFPQPPVVPRFWPGLVGEVPLSKTGPLGNGFRCWGPVLCCMAQVVADEGFEPSKLSRLIYSQLPLAARAIRQDPCAVVYSGVSIPTPLLDGAGGPDQWVGWGC